MTLEKKEFVDYGGDKTDIITLRLNNEERRELELAKRFIKQPKDSTAIKQLVKVAVAVVLHDRKTKEMLNIIMNNARKNYRTGVEDLEFL